MSRAEIKGSVKIVYADSQDLEVLMSNISESVKDLHIARIVGNSELFDQLYHVVIANSKKYGEISSREERKRREDITRNLPSSE